MIALNATFLDALQYGKGKPIFYLTLYEYVGAAWSSLGNFQVIKAELTRLKFTLRVHENLIGTPNIVNTSGVPYAVTVTRGLTVGTTDYSIVTRKYFVSTAEYRREMVKVLTGRAIKQALALA